MLKVLPKALQEGHPMGKMISVKKYKDEIILSVLILYIITLAIGVIGELFDIEWILKFPLFKI